MNRFKNSAVLHAHGKMTVVGDVGKSSAQSLSVHFGRNSDFKHQKNTRLRQRIAGIVQFYFNRSETVDVDVALIEHSGKCRQNISAVSAVNRKDERFALCDGSFARNVIADEDGHIEAFALQCFFNNLCDFVVANTLRPIHDHDGGVFVSHRRLIHIDDGAAEFVQSIGGCVNNTEAVGTGDSH